MTEPEIETRKVLIIYHDFYELEYEPNEKTILLNWTDEEGEENSILLYDKVWNLSESPIKDLVLLNKYLKFFEDHQ